MVLSAKRHLKDFNNITIEKQNCMELSYHNETYDTIVMTTFSTSLASLKKPLPKQKWYQDHIQLIVNNFITEGLSFLNKLSMIYRYLKTYQKPSMNHK